MSSSSPISFLAPTAPIPPPYIPAMNFADLFSLLPLPHVASEAITILPYSSISVSSLFVVVGEFWMTQLPTPTVSEVTTLLDVEMGGDEDDKTLVVSCKECHRRRRVEQLMEACCLLLPKLFDVERLQGFLSGGAFGRYSSGGWVERRDAQKIEVGAGGIGGLRGGHCMVEEEGEEFGGEIAMLLSWKGGASPSPWGQRR